MNRTRADRPTPTTNAFGGAPGWHASLPEPAPPTRVGKSMHPGQPGTVRLQQRFGPSLILVRHRYDWTGLYRYTTVELLVDATPVTQGPCLTARYAVRLKSNEGTLVARAKQLGARWSQSLLCWTLSGQAVQTLGLARRIESATVPHRLHRRGPRKS